MTQEKINREIEFKKREPHWIANGRRNWLKSRAKNLNKLYKKEFEDTWKAKIDKMKTDYNDVNINKMLKKLERHLKKSDQVFKKIEEKIGNELKKIENEYSMKKMEDMFDEYEIVLPDWRSLYEIMMKKLHKIAKMMSDTEDVLYKWNEDEEEYEYLDSESRSLKALGKYLRRTREMDRPSTSSSESDESEDDKESSESHVSDELDENSSTNSECSSDENSEVMDNKVCKNCGKKFPFESFLKHVTHVKKCEKFYGKVKMSSLKLEHGEVKWKKHDREKYEAKAQNNGEKSKMMKCEGCEETLPEERFYKHVSHSKKCLNSFGKDKWDAMKKKRRADVRKVSESKSGRKKVKTITERKQNSNQKEFEIKETDTTEKSQVEVQHKTKSESPEIMKENKNYIKKRKPIKFSFTDLESWAEDENDSDFESSSKPDCSRSQLKRKRH